MQIFETELTKLAIFESDNKVVLVAADKEFGDVVVVEDFAQVFYLDSFTIAVEFAKDLLKK